MGAIRDTLLGYKHQKTENLLKTLEDKVLKNEASEKNSALTKQIKFGRNTGHRVKSLLGTLCVLIQEPLNSCLDRAAIQKI